MFGLRLRMGASSVSRSALLSSSSVWRRSFVRCAAREVTETLGAWTQNAKLKDWIAANVKLMAPDAVHFCDGMLYRRTLTIGKKERQKKEEKQKQTDIFFFFFFFFFHKIAFNINI
jgi:hypothetical protein